MRRRNWLLVGILLIVVALVALQAVSLDRRTTVQGAGEAGSSEAADRARSARVAETSPASISAPLPPAGAPVSGIFDALERRADAGDGQAACRLAVELIRCRSAAETAARGGLDQWQEQEQSFAKDGMPAAADHAASAQLRLLGTTEKCQGVTAAQRQLAGRYLHQAARSGINEAMVRFADGQAFENQRSIFGLFQDPLFEPWKRDAPGFAQRALAQGEPAAITMLMTAYSDDNSLFGGLIRDDLVAWRAQRLLIARLRGTSPGASTLLDARQERSAQAEAARMHREHFNDEVYPEDRQLNAALDIDGYLAGGAAPSEPCR